MLDPIKGCFILQRTTPIFHNYFKKIKVGLKVGFYIEHDVISEIHLEPNLATVCSLFRIWPVFEWLLFKFVCQLCLLPAVEDLCHNTS